MQTRVQKYLKRTLGCAFSTTNFRLHAVAFDVVGYNKDTNVFHIVECKKSGKAAQIGHCFGQLLAYEAVLHQAGYEFLERFFEEGQSGITLDDVAHPLAERKLPIMFYVGLTENACQNVDLLQLIRRSLSSKIGIIRVKPNGVCRSYIRVKGQENHDVCEPEVISVPITRVFTHRQFLKEVTRRVASRLEGTEFARFKTDIRVDKPYGDWAKFWYKRRAFHYEVLTRKTKHVELALHLEGRRSENLSLLNYYRTRRKQINRKLDGSIEMGLWQNRSWARIFERWPRTELTEEYVDKTSDRISDFIRTLQPLMEKWQSARSH